MAKVKRPKTQQPPKQQDIFQNPAFWLGSGGMLLVLIILLAIVANRSGASAPDVAAVSGRFAELGAVGRTVGPEDAPVKIVEFSDYSCPHCLTAHKTLLDPILEYVEQGQVYFELQPIAFLGEPTVQATQAALCAQEQGMFWPYHDRLFRAQEQYGRSAFTDVRLKEYATDVGLDLDAFAKCLDTKKYLAEVQRLTRDATNQGVVATPTFFINGQKVEGAIPVEEFRQRVEVLLP
nr:DsbA family protein [Ardenticatena sp.]